MIRDCRISVLRWEDGFPVIPHIHYRPSMLSGLVESLVELTDRRFAIISPFTLCVSVMDVKTESRTCSGKSPLQHLQVAVGVPECSDGAAADKLVDAYRLADIVVHKLNFR